MSNDGDETGRFASPPCFAHELQNGPDGYSAVDPDAARDVARWRKSERERLIASRRDVPADERKRAAGKVAAQLDEIVSSFGAALADTIVGIYWPFRGELNLRDWMRETLERGARIALPVVETKAQPLVFREWTPDARMEPGIWNIPVPVDGARVVPTIVIAPLIGFDRECYRLGYGGGYFDRTLAQLIEQGNRPLIIGVAHSVAEIATIYPQPHDIPMDLIVTESGRFERPSPAN